ncbi:MAG: hypothetical protein JNG84_02675 [Archangium sp.]|nr:hypothetical protein [Archangium sp.]
MFVCGPAAGGPDAEPYYAGLQLAGWPMFIKTEWRKWPQYIRAPQGNERVGPAQHDVARVFEQLRSLIPDLQALNALRQRAVDRRLSA